MLHNCTYFTNYKNLCCASMCSCRNPIRRGIKWQGCVTMHIPIAMIWVKIFFWAFAGYFEICKNRWVTHFTSHFQKALAIDFFLNLLTKSCAGHHQNIKEDWLIIKWVILLHSVHVQLVSDIVWNNFICNELLKHISLKVVHNMFIFIVMISYNV